MNSVTLAFAYLQARLSTTLLHILLLALGMAMMTVLLLFGHQLQQRLYQSGKGVDVVIGAKGSPLQLVLSSIQHMDIPTGNIKLAEAQHLQKHPHIAKAIPISLGDNYQGFRIVGTEPAYLEHFSMELEEGMLWHAPMQAVIGTEVARSTGLKIGSNFIGSHGLVPGGHGHEDQPYRVTGILHPSATVRDRLIFTSLESVWELHSEKALGTRVEALGEKHGHEEEHHHTHKGQPLHHQEDDADHHTHEHDNEEVLGKKAHHHHAHEAEEEPHHTAPLIPNASTLMPDREITALLATYRSHAAALSFPRWVNQNTNMQAASPAFEMARLVDLVGIGTDTLMGFGGFIIAIALAGVWLSLLNSIRERRYDLVLLRVLGASRRKLVQLVLLEGMTIAVIGSGVGVLLGHGILSAVAKFTEKGHELGVAGFIFLPEVFLLWGVLLLISLLACLLPAWEAYRMDIRRACS